MPNGIALGPGFQLSCRFVPGKLSGVP